MTEHVNFASDDATPITVTFDIDELLGGSAIDSLRDELALLSAHGGTEEELAALREQLAALESDEAAVAEAEAIAKARADAVAEAAAEAAAVRGQRRGAETAATEGDGGRVLREGPEDMLHRLDPFGFPDIRQKGEGCTLLNTRENLEHMLREYGISVCYDVYAKDMSIEIPGIEFSPDNAATAAVAEIESLAARNSLPVGKVESYLVNIADRNQRNRVRDWIQSRQWDGTDRIQRLVDTLHAKNRALAEVLLTRWMVGAVRCAFAGSEGFSMQGAFVLQGPQNAGKTRWLERLTRGLDDDLFKEGALLLPDDRDSVLTVVQAWITELGELDRTMNKNESGSLKYFVTLRKDELFLRYAKRKSVLARRTALCGSVNAGTFLLDETGDRRWWVVSVGSAIEHDHELDMQQVWAQVKSMSDDGYRHHLPADEHEALLASNASFRATSAIETKALSEYDWESAKTRPMTHVAFLEELGYQNSRRPEWAEAKRVLTMLTGKDPRKLRGADVWDVPHPLRTREEHLTY